MINIAEEIYTYYVALKAKPYVMMDVLPPFIENVLAPNLHLIPGCFDEICCTFSKMERSAEAILGWIECFLGPTFMHTVYKYYEGQRCEKNVYTYMFAIEIGKRFFIELGQREFNQWPNADEFLSVIDKRMADIISVCQKDPNNTDELARCMIYASKTFNDFYDIEKKRCKTALEWN